LLAFDLHNLIWGVGQPREVAALGRANDQGRYADVTALVNMGEVTARCFASAGMPKGHPFVERMRVRCERAVLCADLRFSSRRQETFLGVEGGKVFAAVQNDPMHEQLVHFVSVMRGARCLADGAVARAVLQLVEATRSAADGGERVGVDQEIGV
jgi:predicted dehydrogenase